MAEEEIKFEFDLDFQWDLVRYICQDKNGGKIVDLVEHNYFEDLNNAIIIQAIKAAKKKYNRVPAYIQIKDELRYLFEHKDYINLLSDEDRTDITTICKKGFSEVVRDGDIIFDKAKKFYCYVKLKHTIENFNLVDFNQYEDFQSKVQDAIIDPIEESETRGIFLIDDIKQRQLNRQSNPNVIPTPYRQINQLTNAGGLSKNSIAVILDMPKKSKTAFLLNTAREYLKRKKKVLYIDLENGEDELAIRLEESIMKLSKRDILSGESDSRVQKQLRKYKRIGGEINIKRLSALSSTVNDIKNHMQFLYRTYGFETDILIVDYAALLGSLKRTDDDTKRIGDVYLELKNLAADENIQHVWTAHHVTRGAEVREKTRYNANDIAKCIDIVRHVQCIYGLNRTPEESEAGVMRLEIVEQRDGKPRGRAIFAFDQEVQHLKEFTKSQRDEYETQFTNIFDEDDNDTSSKKKSTNDI